MTYVKRGSKLGRADLEIRLMAAQRMDAYAIAEAVDATVPGVRGYCRRNWIEMPKAEKRPRGEGRDNRVSRHKDWSADPRAQRMVTMYQQGLTLAKIGTEFNVTRERVRQVVKKCGAERAGVFFRDKLKESGERRKAAAREAKAFANYGIGYELLCELRANRLLDAFLQQRRNAEPRGISWTLTLDEWFAIWQASGKLHLRGRGKDRYCMSRIRDDGGYSLGNVHIQTNVQNAREGFGKTIGRYKEHTGVFCLYPGSARPWLAKGGKHVRLGFFATIEEAVEARRAYLETHPGSGGFGHGKGWTFLKRSKSRPYYMQGPGDAHSYHATEAEANAAYKAACAAHRASLAIKASSDASDATQRANSDSTAFAAQV